MTCVILKLYKTSYFCFAIVMSSVGSFYGLEILYPSEIATLSPKSILKSVTTHLVKVIYLVEPISARWTCAYISLFSNSEILCVWIFVKIYDKNETEVYFLTIFLAVWNIIPIQNSNTFPYLKGCQVHTSENPYFM